MKADTRMNITFVISSLSSGGAERVMSTMANYRAQNNWQITLITLDSTASDFYTLHPDVKRIALGLMDDSNNPWMAIRNNLTRLIKLRRAIKSSKPDIVISFVDRMNIMTLLATRGLGLKVIVSEHTDPSCHNCGSVWSWLRNITYPWAQAVTVLSPSVRQWMEERIGNGKVQVIHNPILKNNKEIDEKSWPNILGEHKRLRTIISMGRLSAEKGFDLLITAFAKVVHSNPEWLLVIFGVGKDRDALIQLSIKLGVEERVLLPGRVNNPMQLLPKAELFVMSSRYEGFGMALCEAMACGLPVISFDCPSGPREIIRDGIDGLLVPPEDVNALAAAMSQLMTDESLRKRLASRAPEVLERFGMEKVMGMWENLVKSVANQD
ncbi:MAG: glycosyltransferase family 4 protein [Candidatus Scalindua sp.]|nr:glycosyltransferase family 4 protein [Candidatus Scalindua sp.]